MTHVTFFRNVDRRYIGFNVEGHAGFAPIGSDIVCAALSIIAQSTVHAIENVVRARVSKTIDQANAKISLIVDERGEAHQRAELFIITMAHVVETLSEQYSANVSFETIDVNVL